MNAFFERLVTRAGTIDELLSEDFEALPGQKGDAALAARRMSAWCRASASGDRSIFARRLARDGLTSDRVLAIFAGARRRPSAPPSGWIKDAIWIDGALQKAGAAPASGAAEPCAFEHLFVPVVEKAEELLWSEIDAGARDNLTESACACLRHSLLDALCDFSAAALYERFARLRNTGDATAGKAEPPPATGTTLYDRFVVEMGAGGWRALFEDKPVLLRLIATITRQWMETTHEFVSRLDADLPAIRRDILGGCDAGRVAAIESDLSDPHNGGRSVKIVAFDNGTRVVYKPKDLRLDAAWHDLVERLNADGAPIDLKAVRAIARDGHGWTEFVDHAGCADEEGCERFFRRAGAWLALFHCFAASDMHQENIIAAGEHPVPIDLETILQPGAETYRAQDAEGRAYEAAMDTIADSVMAVGLLPAYGRTPDNKVFAMGGMTADWNSKIKIRWIDINSDAMRPTKKQEAGARSPNLPHVAGRYARIADHFDQFVAGFEDYANFLMRWTKENPEALLEAFAGIAVRKVIRPTRFYAMLLQRLKNHRNMDDGVIWSAQADFIARLSEWNSDSDPLWPLHRAERSALLALNVPHFLTPNDGNEIGDAFGTSVHSEAARGMDRAHARLRRLGQQEIAWQIEVIKANVNFARPAVQSAHMPKPVVTPEPEQAPARDFFVSEADDVARELAERAIRRGPAAAWIGLDWLGDAEVFQLVCLGPDLYNGAAGIGVFLAAHAAVTGHSASADLAQASVARLRKDLKGRNAARLARSLGLGGATGLGSVVYALAAMAKSLGDDRLLADAHAAATLFTDELIAADKQFDVIGGSAGAILSLLRLYRDGPSADLLKRAVLCGEHLLAQSRPGPEGRRCWVGQGLGPQPLNGMSHGAAGFAYALASLAAAAGREEFAHAASECIAFEDANYDAARHNWPDLRGAETNWSCRWCHGASGIGLARIATMRRGGLDDKLKRDVANALAGAEGGWRAEVDTLCCGALGNIEFICEAGRALGRDDLRDLAGRHLMAVLEAARASGDFRWNSGQRRFNLGLFRGLAGVGYTALRIADASLPNVLIWE
jgi:type 2 lantibiotic biosynthesis protein LanM